MAKKKEQQEIKTRQFIKTPTANTIIIRETNRGQVGNTINSYISPNFYPRRKR